MRPLRRHREPDARQLVEGILATVTRPADAFRDEIRRLSVIALLEKDKV